MTARGIVEGTKGIKGKRVVVNVTSNSANLGELLRFVSKAAEPPAEGTLIIDAALDLPQGKQKVLERVSLEGSVRAERVRFTKDAVQDKIDDLSRKAQGRPADASIDEVASHMATRFALRERRVHLSRACRSRCRARRCNWTARIRCDPRRSISPASCCSNATVSQTQTGFKSWLLKPFDPLFRKNGAGTRLAIKVAGTQDQPKIGLERRTNAQGPVSPPSGGPGSVDTTNSPALSERSSSFTARKRMPSNGIGTDA